MREVRTSWVISLWFLIVCCTSSVDGQIASIAPKSPKIGDVITVIYHPGATGATIQRPSHLTCQTAIVSDVGSAPILIETPMSRSGTSWKGSFELRQPGARYLLFQFVSGNLTDDNVGRGWDALVVRDDGEALQGGHYWRGAALAFGGHLGFKHYKDVDAAKVEVAQERKLYPENYNAVNLAWYLEMNPMPTDAATARIKGELKNELRRFRKNEDALPTLLVWLDQTGDKATADSLRRVLVAEHPKGKVASADRLRQMSKESDQVKKIRLLERYIAEFPLTENEILANQRMLLSMYVEKELYDKAYDLLMSAPKLDVALYTTIASPMTEKGVELEKAVDWVSHGIEIARKQDESSKPASSTVADWEKSQANTLSGLLNSRGLGLSKLGKTVEAESDFAEAYKLTKGNDLIIVSRLIDAFTANGKFREAVETGLECIGKGKSNQPIIEKLRTAFTKFHGSLAGYDKAVQQARAQVESRLLSSGVNKPAPDFSLKDLNGSTVKLSDLRGKVVIVDFWATWSGQCKATFPHIQRVYETYQYYNNVAFLAIDASENSSGSEREALVKKFMTDGKFTVAVLYDDSSSVALKFAAEGIPAEYVIDKRGRIQFKSAGFSSTDEMANELTKEIEVLLKK